MSESESSHSRTWSARKRTRVPIRVIVGREILTRPGSEQQALRIAEREMRVSSASSSHVNS